MSGWTHNAALDSKGRVYTWGDAYYKIYHINSTYIFIKLILIYRSFNCLCHYNELDLFDPV